MTLDRRVWRQVKVEYQLSILVHHVLTEYMNLDRRIWQLQSQIRLKCLLVVECTLASCDYRGYGFKQDGLLGVDWERIGSSTFSRFSTCTYFLTSSISTILIVSCLSISICHLCFFASVVASFHCRYCSFIWMLFSILLFTLFCCCFCFHFCIPFFEIFAMLSNWRVYQKQHLYEVEVKSAYTLLSRLHLWDYTGYVIVIRYLKYTYKSKDLYNFHPHV